jgi:nucleoside-diphosphate-sugar epimerase
MSGRDQSGLVGAGLVGDDLGMRLLVLGGSLFIGRAVAVSALTRGWRVTTFNRGRSGPDVDGVDAVRGDRTVERDVARLAGLGPWDAVVDLCGYVPRQVLAGARLLEPVCGRYVLVSTVSVYAGWPVEPLTEHSAVLDCPADAGAQFGPPDVEDGPTRYGRLKAGCELAAQEVFGTDRTIVVRPGVVLGPGEYVGRLPWWLRRIAAGGRVVAPGAPTRTIQPVDVRDVAAFVLDGLHGGLAGVYNVTAPVGRDTFADLLQACQTVTGSHADLVWVPDGQLLALGVRQWSELPLWRTHAGVWQVDSAAALAAGLRCRGLADTAAATWRWMTTSPSAVADERSAEIGLSAQREQSILASVS